MKKSFSVELVNGHFVIDFVDGGYSGYSAQSASLVREHVLRELQKLFDAAKNDEAAGNK